MSPNTKVADERAPLLGPQPSTVDAGNEYLPDSEIEDDSGRISVSRAAICVVALGSLIFLQGMQSTSKARIGSKSERNLY